MPWVEKGELYGEYEYDDGKETDDIVLGRGRLVYALSVGYKVNFIAFSPGSGSTIMGPRLEDELVDAIRAAHARGEKTELDPFL